MTPSEKCDQMLNDLAFLMYGVAYDQLGSWRQCRVISEATFKFSSSQLAAGNEEQYRTDYP